MSDLPAEGPKVTLNAPEPKMQGATPTLNGAAVVTDSRGRALLVKRLNALERLRLYKALGNDLSRNQMYLGTAVLAASVRAIDGESVEAPLTERMVEALVSQVGDEGIDAVAQHFQQFLGADEEMIAAAKN